MKTIDLNEHYPGHSETRRYIDVSDEVAALFQAEIAAEKAYQRKMRYHKVKFLEDISAEVEHEAALQPSAAIAEAEEVERKRAIISAFTSLTPVQARRAIAYFYERQTAKAIARKEGVAESTIKSSIRGARVKLMEKLKNYL